MKGLAIKVGAIWIVLASSPAAVWAGPVTLGDLGWGSVKYEIEKKLIFQVVGAATEITNEMAELIRNIFGIDNKENKLPPLGISLIEDAKTANFSLTGVRPNDSQGTIRFGGKDSFWEGQLSLTLNAAPLWFRDSVSFSGQMVHKKGPHASDGVGTQILFEAQLAKNDEYFRFKVGSEVHDGKWSTNHANNEHEDQFVGTWARNYDGNEIANWTAGITATHVPEPGTLLNVLVGLAALVCVTRYSIGSTTTSAARL